MLSCFSFSFLLLDIALPEAEGSLVFGQGMSVMKLPRDGTPGSKLFMKTRQTVVGVGYDCRDEHVYWTDISGRAIMRASLDGRDASVVVNTSKFLLWAKC